jgi:phosphatidylglycerophosphate synthase
MLAFEAILAMPAQPIAVHAPVQLAALRRDALQEAAACALLLALVAAALHVLGGFSPWFAVKALIGFGLAFAWLASGLAQHAPHARFGAGNRVTLGRLALVALLAAGIGEAQAGTEAVAWGTVAVATAAALLDAVDGPLARGHGQASAFGARFDMECDALTVLVLSLLVVQFDKAGAWIVAAGLMRYAFVLAAWRWHRLERPLPASLRRKAVCVVQITCLIVCLGPVVAVGWSTLIAAASLAMLAGSFALDVAWLLADDTARGATHVEAGGIPPD